MGSFCSLLIMLQKEVDRDGQFWQIRVFISEEGESTVLLVAAEPFASLIQLLFNVFFLLFFVVSRYVWLIFPEKDIKKETFHNICM